MEEVEQTFRMLLGKTNGLGLSNATVLVQEFLTGVNPKYVYIHIYIYIYIHSNISMITSSYHLFNFFN